jgi:enoyl-CoA hydratase/carnithine racemase
MSTNPVPSPEPPLVLVERSGGAVRLTLNRGERFNALSSAMIAALQREVDAIAADRKRASSSSRRPGAGSAPGTT